MGNILGTIYDVFKAVSSVVTLLRTLSSGFNDALKRAAESPGLPNPAPTHPYWLNDPPFPELVDIQSPRLPNTADVVIIGSGITGAAVARSLLRELRRSRIKDKTIDTQILVLEARQICSGATGRNGGHIKPSAYDSFDRLSRTFPRHRAAALARFQARHVECLVEMCRAEGIDIAEAREVETVDLFLDRETFDKASVNVDVCRKWMPEVEAECWEGDELEKKFGVNKSVVGAITHPAGAIWPYRFVVSIWKRLQDEFPDDIAIETNTAVQSVMSSDADAEFPYAIKTSRGVIHAKHVVHTTNAFASHLVPGLRSKITGARAHMSAHKPGDKFPKLTSPAGSRSWGVYYGGAFDYVTQRPSSSSKKQTTSGGGDLLLGGGFTKSLHQGIDQVGLYDDGKQPDALTTTHIIGIFPALFAPNWGAGGEVKQLWTGIIGMTGDLVPLVGRLDEELTGRKGGTTASVKKAKQKGGEGKEEQSLASPGEWIAAGFSGEGMVWAWLCGTGLGIMMAGTAEEEAEEEPGRPGGKLAAWFPEELLISKKRLRSAHVTNLVDMM